MLLGFAAAYTQRMSTQPPVEDINAIVSRFQAWAGAQSAATAKDGVRELTYDEAIRSRRLRSRDEKTVAEAEEPASVPVSHRKIENAAKPKKKANSRRVKPAQIKHVSRKDTVASPKTPAFRQVLAEKVSILPATSSQELAERRTTALSLRISLAEHALLKKRAAEESLSVSCYLRNCIFEIEQLRAQVRVLQAANAARQALPHRGGILRFLYSVFGGSKNTFNLRA